MADDNKRADEPKSVTTHDDHNAAGVGDAGKNDQDADILGKKQEDLSADNLKGDARADDDPHKTENATKAGRDIDTDAGQE